MDFAVCVLFFERPHQTVSCIRSFSSSGRSVYVLNNGSSSASRDLLSRELAGLPRVVLIESTENLGVARGRNRLIEETTQPWLLFADSDITVETVDWDAQLTSSVDRYPELEAFSPRTINVHEGEAARFHRMIVKNGVVGFEPLPETDETNVFPGGAALVKRSLFERLGSYDPRMQVGFEDFELALRALRANAPIRVRAVPSVRLLHEHLPITNDADRRAARARYDADELLKSYHLLTQKHDVGHSMRWVEWVKEQRRHLNLDD